MRAIENRVPIVRSANSGISMFVDRAGRIKNASDLFFTGLLTEPVALREKITFFTRHGMWLGRACVWITFLFCAAGATLAIVDRFRDAGREGAGAGGV